MCCLGPGMLGSNAGGCPTACPQHTAGPGITLKSIPKACQSRSCSTASGIFWAEMCGQTLLPWAGFCDGMWRPQVSGYRMPAWLTRDAAIEGSWQVL